MTQQLTRDQARRIAVRAQRLDADRPGDVTEVAEKLGATKIDPTPTIAPAEHTILWSRISSGYDQIHFSKATENDRFRTEVLARLRAERPLLATEIPDTAEVVRPPEGWFGSDQTAHMLDVRQRQRQREREVAIIGREGRHRRGALAERVYPRDLRDFEFDDAERAPNERRLSAAGIAKQKSPWTPVGEAGEAATIDGLRQKGRVDPEAVAALDDDVGGRVAFLSPYDGILFDRPRLREIFEFDCVLEKFKPKPPRTPS